MPKPGVPAEEISFFSIQEIISFSEGKIFGGKASGLAKEAKKAKVTRIRKMRYLTITFV